MSDFLIQSPHTKEECLHALDETLAKGPDVLAKFEFSCNTGEHTAYAVVNVKDESAARSLVPTFLQSKAKFIPIAPYTPEQIRSYHQK